ncbi:MAG: urate hydroxylase PuuD, partial [Candidatus Sericytochromatia bacterium]|nr:urate hydroxylase PuuD [Candidatus Sericytochromatia bacterium]
MDFNILEWLSLIVRWVHVIFGIMWIGSSIFFNWLDSSFEPLKAPEDGVVGEVWMVHGGGFYHVKKKYLKASEMPENLYWFKWEAGFTFITGITLLSIVYYLSGGAFLLDSTVSNITNGQAIGLGIGTLIIGWLVYDTIWNSPLAKKPLMTSTACFLMVIGVAYALTHILSSRAAYIHVGAMMGTIMAANVWIRILPGQTKMLKAVKEGKPVDPAPGLRAKMRSKHNNYMTYPVIFIMISNHFPITYGNDLNWLILAVLIVASAVIKHFLNTSENFSFWAPRSAGVMAVSLLALMFITYKPKNIEASVIDTNTMVTQKAVEKVKFTQVKQIINQRCVACHSTKPTDDVFTVAPAG